MDAMNKKYIGIAEKIVANAEFVLLPVATKRKALCALLDGREKLVDSGRGDLWIALVGTVGQCDPLLAQELISVANEVQQ